MTDLPDPAERRTRYAAAMAVRDGDTWPTTYENDGADYLRRADAAMAVADAEMADRAAQLDRLRTENSRMRHELEVMYGGAFDTHADERPTAPTGEPR
ncbi:hypothetical protein [Streptomyces sp. NPDC051994]|uniref:hypothetical protein n=1 Tax=unclassified Streptomyces TaxID=2593676 RepID=UPI003432738F